MSKVLSNSYLSHIKALLKPTSINSEENFKLFRLFENSIVKRFFAFTIRAEQLYNKTQYKAEIDLKSLNKQAL